MYITWDKFDVGWYSNIPAQKRRKGNQSTSQKYYYKDIITAFDIETTYIKEIDQSVMYIWQWQFGSETTVIGRSWYDFKKFIKALEAKSMLTTPVTAAAEPKPPLKRFAKLIPSV